MDDNTPPEQQTALLPVDPLKKICLDERVEYTFKEFRLKGRVETSLKAFVDICFLENNGEYIQNRIVWIAENAFVRLGDGFGLPSGCYRYRRFGLKLSTSSDHSSCVHNLSIHSSTTESAIAALDFLAGLQDSHFKTIELNYYDRDNDSIGRPICPLRGRHLEIFVRNANRENSFIEMIFTRDQCRTLATSGIRTNIGFSFCWFQDDGTAFVEASAARENQDSGPAKLSIRRRLPFDEVNFRRFLNQHRLESLTLFWIPLQYEESCRALAAADLQHLELPLCELADGGAALVESVKNGRGPRGLRLARRQFDSAERFLFFINALRGNTYLERLELLGIYICEGSPQALAGALLENKGLVHFSLELCRCRLDGPCWSELMGAISTHPTLRTLMFRGINNFDEGASSLSTKRARTKSVADMLLVNKRVDRIHFDSDTFDRDDWNLFVAPMLDWNLYRDWFVAIQKIQDLSTRAAVVARALAHVESKPLLVWMVLSQNDDVVCSYLPNEARADSVSVPSRKRRRSPSDDDVGTH
jgi:hypothetical protein